MGMLHKMEGFLTYLLCRSAVKDIQSITLLLSWRIENTYLD